MDETEAELLEIEDYTPLPRPSEPEPPHNQNDFLDLDNDDSLGESDSDEDSDEDKNKNKGSKKPKLKLSELQKNSGSSTINKTSNKYNIWSANVQEEVLADQLDNCEVEKDGSRRIVHIDEPNSRKRSYDQQRSNKLPIRSLSNKHKGYNNKEHQTKGSSKRLLALKVTVEDTEEDIATDISNKLCEEKGGLILRVVQAIGKEKAIELFNITKTIERGGGMLVMNQSRRRTSGGVFLYHVRDIITPEQNSEIFGDERKQYESKKRQERSKQRRAKAKALSQHLNLGTDKINDKIETSPTVLSEEEQIGTGNPPPSPVTVEEQQLQQQQQTPVEIVERSVTTYDDFLDIDMDVAVEEF